jgi:hypothetical protein
MAIWAGNQPAKDIVDVNKELLNLHGELDDRTAKITLAKFLRHNIGFTSQLILGINMEAMQVMHINAMFEKNNCMLIFSRGGGKSTLAGWYCILKCIFEPGTRIVIASANFRTSRRIFEEIVRLLNTEEAQLARSCFDKKPYLRNDKFQWDVNGGYICAIPLSEDTRGMRCDVLILDEVLLLSPQMINDVLAPFLSSPRDAAFRIKVRKLEDELIKAGTLHPNNKMIFENAAQMICLSSASYQFQHLYKMYSDWTDFVERPDILTMNNKEEERPTYFISQMGWEAIPATILNREFIQSQRASISEDSFQREYGAQFRDGGDGYFSMRKMNECTIPDGEYPHSKVTGDPLKKYILSIDPNYSKSASSDFFAMSVIELDEEKEEGVLVHGYQRIGADLQDHIKYIYYVLTHFNVVLIIADSSNLDTIIDACNESELFKGISKKITYITEWDSTKDGQDQVDMLIKAKKQYSPDMGCMCIRQTPSTDWIMRSNSYLQSCIDHKKIWFASRASNHPEYMSYMFNLRIPLKLVFPRGSGILEGDSKEDNRKLSIREFIELQDDIIISTKEQCANIEVTSTSRGHQSFDLPRSARTSTANNKPRKDNYSTLLLGNWGIKCYFELVKTQVEIKREQFIPTLI